MNYPALAIVSIICFSLRSFLYLVRIMNHLVNEPLIHIEAVNLYIEGSKLFSELSLAAG